MTKLFMILIAVSGLSFSAAAEEKPVGMLTVTFDDATITQYNNGLRIANEYGILGTIFVTSKYMEGGEDWSMNWEQVRQFHESGWEIGSHSHSHPSDMPNLGPSDLAAELDKPLQLIEENVGVKPVSYASPHGNFNDQVVDAVLERYNYHFRAWGGNEGRNPLDALDPRDIGRMDVSFDMTSEYVCGAILQAASQGHWLVLIFHGIVEGEPAEYQVSVDNFEEMMSCAATMQRHGILSVVTAKEGAQLVIVNRK